MGWFKGLNKIFRTLDPIGKAITDKTKGKFDPVHLYQDPKQAKKAAAKKAAAQAAKEASAAANLVSGGGLGLAGAVGAITQAPQAEPGFMDSEIFGMPAPLVVGLGVVIIGVGAYLLIKKA